MLCVWARGKLRLSWNPLAPSSANSSHPKGNAGLSRSLALVLPSTGNIKEGLRAESRAEVLVLEGAARSQELKSCSQLWEGRVSVLWDEEVLVVTGTG